MKKHIYRSTLTALLLMAATTVPAQVFVTSDMLPLDITESGLYVVAEPLTFAGPGDAITIHTNHVTIDLNGFPFTGPGSGHAIRQAESLRALVVMDGTVSGWGSSVDHVGAIVAEGSNNRFSSLRVHTSQSGIDTGDNAIIEHCHIYDLTHDPYAFGIQAMRNALITMCLVEGVVSPTSYGILVGEAALVERCIVTGIGAVGTTEQAQGIGVSSGRVVDSSVSDIFGSDFGTGMGADGSLSVESTTVSGIFSTTETEGITVPQGSQIVRSVIGPVGNAGNAGAAVILTGARMSESVAHHAGHLGIRTEAGSRLENSLSVFHDKAANAAAILLVGTRNYVEGNLLASSFAPVIWSAADTNSVIIRNAAYDNNIGLSTLDNHRADTLVAPGVDFNHPTRSYYFENVQW